MVSGALYPRPHRFDSDGAERVTQSNSPPVDVTVTTAPAVATGGTLGGGKESPEARRQTGRRRRDPTPEVAAGVPLSPSLVPAWLLMPRPPLTQLSRLFSELEQQFLSFAGTKTTMTTTCGREQTVAPQSETVRSSARPPVRPASACVVLCCTAVHATPRRAAPRHSRVATSLFGLLNITAAAGVASNSL